jgi:hypothetical protein
MPGLKVGTAVNFNLGGNTIHAGFTTAESPLVVGPRATPPVMMSASTATMDRRHAAPVPGNGCISGLRYGTGVGQENFLDRVKGKESVAVNQDRRMDRCESAGASNPLPEIEDLHLLGKGVHTVFGQILVEVVLFNVFFDVGLKSVTTAFRFKLVHLKVLDDPIWHRSCHCLAKEISVKVTVSLLTVLDFEELLRVSPCERLPPVVLESGEYRGVVGEESWGPNAGFFQGLEVMVVVSLPPVLFKDGSA